LAKGANRDWAPMSPIWLSFRFRVRFERLRRLTKGDNSYYEPMSPIWLFFRFRERLRSFLKGDNKD